MRAMTSSPAPAGARTAAQAMGWMHTARFLTTAPTLEFLPPSDFPEVAFVGVADEVPVGKK